MSGEGERPSFDPLAIIRVLRDHGVRFVVIGGLAAGVQGVVWATTDLDICYARSRLDHGRLADALVDLNARPVDVPDGITVRLDARALALGDVWTLTTRFGELDCLGSPAPGIDYTYLYPRSRAIRGSQTYQVASLDDLIEMKRAAGRPKDLAQVEMLRAAREETQERER